MENDMSLESHFAPYRERIVGIDAEMASAFGGTHRIVYADWTASGRLYHPIEDFMRGVVGPLVANTHTETTYTGVAMTRAYHRAREIIKQHVGAGSQDSLFFSGFGMTSAINKLQRMLGLRRADGLSSRRGGLRPLVLVTHMEHHSNQITWEECDVDVRIVPRDEATGLPDPEWQERILKENLDRPLLLGAFTACSNVTGLVTPYRRMAELMHRYGGFCFIDFAASAPYVEMDMHPAKPEESLDAITFSPHKFLGGPGASGVLILSNTLYKSGVPDQPGGGTVKWTTPFGTHRYVDEIEAREDGGTPGFLQAIRAALAMQLKLSMGIDKIEARERELIATVLDEFKAEPALRLLEGENMNRLAILSFYAPGEHHNLIVRLLNDRYGIQARGGCSCAGTYGHILFDIKKTKSHRITDMIDAGDLSEKPGWVRVSLHPTTTDEEARYIGRAVVDVIRNFREWGDSYEFHKESGEFEPKLVHQNAPDLLSRFSAL
jgi:selenocysteine lyase/cysteine desulfurase